MRDEQIEAALEVTCDFCGAGSGEECTSFTYPHGPLLDETGFPVHLMRGIA